MFRYRVATSAVARAAWVVALCLLLIVSSAASTSAQADHTLIPQAELVQGNTCPAIVEQALTDVAQGCTSTARNQACYGYVSLQATPRDGVQNFAFSKEGDLANVADIDSLQLSRLDTANNTWGIALMRLQANLPDALPGQFVTFLMFGDVQVQNAVTPSGGQGGVQVTASGRVNIRSAPSTSGAIIGTVTGGQTAAANGRNADGSWLRIQIPSSDALGWVSASVVKTSGDASALPVVDSTQVQTQYTPMQAFYFQTGITQTSCTEAPPDGILIQTPQGAGQVNLLANGVDMQFGSTAFLQAQPNGVMTVSVIEGDVHVTALGTTVDVPAGTQATIPMDANLRPVGPPNAIQPYAAALVAALPIQVLPERITIAQPLTEATPEATPEATAAGGGGAGAGGASSGGTGAGGTAYQITKVMNLGGENISGSVCVASGESFALQAFTMTMQTPRVTFDITFTPTGPTQGTWAYQYSIPSAGETDSASGTYTVSDPGADGSRRVVMDGKGQSVFRGGNPTFSLHYEFGLTAGSGACSGG